MNDSVAGTISLFELTWRGMEAIKPVLSGFDTLKSPRAERLSPKQPHHPAARQGTRPLERGRAVYGDCPGYSAPGSMKGIFGGVFTLTAERGSVPWHCVDGESPRGEGLTGRGEAETAPPSHVACVSPVERFTSITPTSRPLRGLLPPPPEGAGSVWRLARIQCTGTETGFRQGVHTDGREVASSLTPYRWDITLQGDGRSSSPMSPVSLVERLSPKHPRRPARSAPPPAPSRGGGQCMAIVRIQCIGDRERISAGCSR